MKKLIFSFTLLAILFAFSFEKAEAQPCPSGYSSGTYTHSISGCNFDIEYCYKCEPTGITDIVLGTITAPAGCDISLVLANFSAVKDAVVYYIYTSGSCSIQPCGTIPPTIFSVKVTAYICNKVINYVHLEFGIMTHWYSQLIPCDPGGAYCERHYSICVDNNQTPPLVYVNYLSSTPYGSPSCSAGVPTLPPSRKTWNQYWDTGCFTTGCNN